VAEIKKQCDGMKETNECISDYSSLCSTKSMREFMRSVTHQGDGKSWYTEFCTKDNPAEREKYLKHAVCLNNAQKEAKTCIRDMTVALDKAIASDIGERNKQSLESIALNVLLILILFPIRKQNPRNVLRRSSYEKMFN
jgi:hypothetical protein